MTASDRETRSATRGPGGTPAPGTLQEGSTSKETGDTPGTFKETVAGKIAAAKQELAKSKAYLAMLEESLAIHQRMHGDDVTIGDQVTRHMIDG